MYLAIINNSPFGFIIVGKQLGQPTITGFADGFKEFLLNFLNPGAIKWPLGNKGRLARYARVNTCKYCG